MNVLDLFSGIGGFSLGLERAGMKTAAFCEIEPYCRRVLAKHWPGVPCYEDVRTLTAARLKQDGIKVDVICGGFPCQPFSTASRGRRVAISMWPEFFRIVADVRPTHVIVENVQALAISVAASDLECIGYASVCQRIGAHDIGADHSRDRWWLRAYAYDKGKLSSRLHAEVAVLPEIRHGVWNADNYARTIRIPHGVSHRVDRLRALGNAVVPAIPEMLGRAIMQWES